MIQTVSSATENAFVSNSVETPRRRSTFYVPLVVSEDSVSPSTDDSTIDTNHNNDDDHMNAIQTAKRSLDPIYNPDLSACSFELSLNESADLMVSNEVEPRIGIKRTASSTITARASKTAIVNTNADRVLGERSNDKLNLEISNRNKVKRYGIVLNGSVNIDDEDKLPTNDENECHDDQEKSPSNTSTPIKMMKSRSRSNILCLPDKSFQLSPLKEKSKTLPQNLSPKMLSTTVSATNLANSQTNTSTFPPKYSFLLKSSPKISLNYSFDAVANVTATSPSNNTKNHNYNNVTTVQISDKKTHQLAASPASVASPRKALSFIRRAHSTKLSRSNSLLKSLTSKCVDQSAENLLNPNQPVYELPFDRFEECFKSDNFYALMKEIFSLKEANAESNNNINNNNDGLENSTIAVNSSSTPKELNAQQKCDDEVHSGKYLMSMHIQMKIFAFHH